MTAAATAVVVGESLLDLLPGPDGGRLARPGGSPANVAVGLAGLGLPVTLVTSYGDDAAGRLVDRHLRDAGVHPVRSRAASTSTATVSIDAQGNPSYEFSLQWALDPLPPLAVPSVLHVGSLAPVLAPGCDAVLGLVDAWRGATLVTYDPNCRPALMGPPAEARPVIEAMVTRSHVVKASEDDLAWLYPGRSLEQVARDWLGLGPSLVVVTRGARGAQAWTGHHVAAVGAAPGEPLTNTVGAGDAFMAMLLRRIASLHAAQVARLGADSLVDLLLAGTDHARRTCELSQADQPWAVA